MEDLFFVYIASSWQEGSWESLRQLCQRKMQLWVGITVSNFCVCHSSILTASTIFVFNWYTIVLNWYKIFELVQFNCAGLFLSVWKKGFSLFWGVFKKPRLGFSQGSKKEHTLLSFLLLLPPFSHLPHYPYPTPPFFHSSIPHLFSR